MKVLRASMYPPKPMADPMTMVMRDTDLRVPIAEAANTVAQPGMFVITDIFDAPPAISVEQATFMAMRRQQASSDDEKNAAIAYYWWAKVVNDHRGSPRDLFILSEKPAPLNADQLGEVMRQLTLLPTYRGGILQTFDKHRQSVRLEYGRVVKGGMPVTPPVGPQRGGRFNG